MAYTFGDLKTRVGEILIDLPTVVQNAIPQLINDAIRSLEDQHDFKVMESVALFTTQVDSNVLVAADPYVNWKQWRLRPFITRNDGSQKIITLAPDTNSALFAMQSVTGGEPQMIVDDVSDDDGNRSIDVLPIADGLSDYDDGEYRIVFPYWRYLPDLVNDADTNWFVVNAREYLIRQAAAEGFAMDWDTQNAAVWEAKAQKKYSQVVKADKMLRLGAVYALVPHWEGALTPTVPR